MATEVNGQQRKLSEVINRLRKETTQGNELPGTSLRMGRMLSEAALVANALSEEARQAFEQAAERLSHAQDETGRLEAERILMTHAKEIGRRLAKSNSPCYPVPVDITLVNELLTQLPPQADEDRLRTGLERAQIVPPGTDLFGRTAWLSESLLLVEPFDEGNGMTALLIGIAFLHANGQPITHDLEQTRHLLRNLLDRADSFEEALRQRVGEGKTTPLTYHDAIEMLVSRYRDVLANEEHAWRLEQASKNMLVPVSQAALQPRPGTSSELHYLTVQDVIWINSEITGSVQSFRYDALEECTYYQYSYRQSRDLQRQAARFLMGFLKYAPFEKGSAETALIAVLTFLEINGYHAHLPASEAKNWLEQVMSRKKHPLDAVRQIGHPAPPNSLPLAIRETAHHLIQHLQLR
jgi:prophage maintenance system killer protein